MKISELAEMKASNPLTGFTNQWAIALCFLIIAASYYFWTFSTELAGYGGDNAFYLLTAEYFSPWSKTSTVAAYFAKSSLYPPLYPLVLALFGGAESILLAHIITTTILLLVMVMLFRWLVFEGLKPGFAMLIVCIFAALPGTYMQAASIHSENLYLLTSLTALYYAAAGKQQSRALLIAAIFVALATMTRGAGIALLAGFWIFLMFDRRKGWWLCGLIATIPHLAWSLLHDHKSESYLDLLSNSYLGNESGSILAQLKIQLASSFGAWAGTFTSGRSGLVLLVVLGILCLCCTLKRLSQKKLDGIYAVLYLGMIFSWPYPAEMLRLLFPITAILLGQLFIVIHELKANPKWQKRCVTAELLLVLALVITLIPNIALTVSRLNAPVEDELRPYKRISAWYHPVYPRAINAVSMFHTMKESLMRMPELVPEGECIISIKPSIVSFYSQRISKEPPFANVPQEEFNRRILQTGCTYLYLIFSSSPSYSSSFYPHSRLQEEIQFVEIYGSKHITDYPVAILARLKNDVLKD